MRILENIQDWYWSHKERWKAILSYIKHVYTVDDRDWDYSYLISLIKWKLQRMAGDTNGWLTVGASRNQRQIEYAIYLIDRWQGDDGYEKQVMDEHYKKWGRSELVTTPADDILPNCVRVEAIYPNGNPPEATEEFLKVCRQIEERKKDAEERFYRHLQRYLHRWWS